ncbi:MAG: prepilin peptidase [Alphaproteobacteria bacterium]|nr:MAG: prepilin peptidase [Alphaproteobacteria bacterium]
MTSANLLVLLVLVMGPVLASFFATVAERLPAGRPLSGRSRCDSCARPLGALSLVPILSYFLLRGRCRRCGAPIPRRLLFFELAGLGLAVHVLLIMGPSPLALVSLVFALTLLAVAVIDVRHLYIPDVLSLPLIPAGLAVALFEPRLDVTAHFIGAVAGFALMWFVAWSYRRLRGREGLGGGDAKLMAAGGAWVAWEGLPLVLLIASASGLLFVAILRLAGRRLALQDAIPFAPFLAFAIWMVWLHAPPLAGG